MVTFQKLTFIFSMNYPMFPEKSTVTKDMLSQQQIDDMKDFNIKNGTTKKLIPNLFSKKNPIVHCRNLKYYLAYGWKLTKVHRILEFKQSPWMKPYIDFNTEKLTNICRLCSIKRKQTGDVQILV